MLVLESSKKGTKPIKETPFETNYFYESSNKMESRLNKRWSNYRNEENMRNCHKSLNIFNNFLSEK